MINKNNSLRNFFKNFNLLYLVSSIAEESIIEQPWMCYSCQLEWIIKIPIYIEKYRGQFLRFCKNIQNSSSLPMIYTFSNKSWWREVFQRRISRIWSNKVLRIQKIGSKLEKDSYSEKMVLYKGNYGPIEKLMFKTNRSLDYIYAFEYY